MKDGKKRKIEKKELNLIFFQESFSFSPK